MDTKENKEVKYIDMSANCELNLSEILQQAFGSYLTELIKKNLQNLQNQENEFINRMKK